MRVLQVVAARGTGGAEAVVLGLTEGMVARGHRVWVASDHGWRVPLVHRMGGADHVRIPLAAPGPPSLAAAAGRLLAWSPGRPVDLVHAHNVRVVAVSAAVADDLEHAGLPGERIRVIENAVTLPETSWEADPLPEVPAAGPVVLCAARMTRQKRQDLLLRGWAARRSAGGQLLLAGDGPERERLESLARELDLGPEVRFLGDRDDVPALLGRADLLALPSDWEGLPIGVLEALAVGLPVLASAVGGLADLDGAVELVAAQGTEAELARRWADALDSALSGEAAPQRQERARRRWSGAVSPRTAWSRTTSGSGSRSSLLVTGEFA